MVAGGSTLAVRLCLTLLCLSVSACKLVHVLVDLSISTLWAPPPTSTPLRSHLVRARSHLVNHSLTCFSSAGRYALLCAICAVCAVRRVVQMRRLVSLCRSARPLPLSAAPPHSNASHSATLCFRIPASPSPLCNYSTLAHASSAPRPLLQSSMSPSRLSVSASRCAPSFSLSLPGVPPHSLFRLPVRFATKKAGGSVKNSRDSPGRRLGLKTSGGSRVSVGDILVRQRGLQTHPGRGVGVGRDHTLFARRTGEVVFTYLLRPYRRRRKWRKLINVIDRQQGEGEAELADTVAVMQAEYLQVLKMKRQGVRVPTVRSVYLAEVEKEKRLEARRETEAMLARVTAQQQQRLEEQRPAALLS